MRCWNCIHPHALMVVFDQLLVDTGLTRLGRGCSCAAHAVPAGGCSPFDVFIDHPLDQ